MEQIRYCKKAFAWMDWAAVLENKKAMNSYLNIYRPIFRDPLLENKSYP